MNKKTIAFDIDNTLFYISSSILTNLLEVIFNTKKIFCKDKTIILIFYLIILKKIKIILK